MALSDNLEIYYACDEASGNLVDSHSTHDATETGGTIDATTGKVSGGRDFEAGDTEHFIVLDNATISTGNIDFTWAFWIKPEATAGGDGILYKWRASGGNREFAVTFSSNQIIFFVTHDGATTASVTATNFGALSAGTWYFVVVYHDSVNDVIGVSINAGTPDTTSHSTGVFSSNADLVIGANGNDLDDFYDGVIDEMGFWKRVLTSDERTELYNSGNGRDYAYITGGGGGGLAIPIAAYHLNHHLTSMAN